MKIVAGIATFNARLLYAERAIESLKNQVDEIYLYNNSVNDDLTDNGKFFGATRTRKPCFYFSCDDDIIYPADYVRKMIVWLNRFNGNAVVTHHGRILRGMNKNYYTDHYAYSCMKGVGGMRKIDVPGSGVSAFRTDKIDVRSIVKSNDHRMSDLLLGLEATKQNVPVYILPHARGYFRDMNVPAQLTCFGMEHKNPKRQGEIADEIYRLNYGNQTPKG